MTESEKAKILDKLGVKSLTALRSCVLDLEREVPFLAEDVRVGVITPTLGEQDIKNAIEALAQIQVDLNLMLTVMKELNQSEGEENDRID